MLKYLNVNNLKLGTKMTTIMLVPVLSLILISTIALFNLDSLTKVLISNLYNEIHLSEYWLLNADRDFYQALTAESALEISDGTEDTKKLKSSYDENAKQTIERVTKAKEILIKDSSVDVLSFIEKQVIPDYKKLVTTGDQYNNDSLTFNDLVTDLSSTAEELLASIQDVNRSIDEVSHATNDGASGMTTIAEKTNTIVDMAGEVIDQSNKSKENVEKLLAIVSKFKI